MPKIERLIKDGVDTPKWLVGAAYSGDMDCMLPWLDVYLPNSFKIKHIRFRGRAQCDLVICLLDAIFTAYGGKK